jgi:hypothetical protein
MLLSSDLGQYNPQALLLCLKSGQQSAAAYTPVLHCWRLLVLGLLLAFLRLPCCTINIITLRISI